MLTANKQYAGTSRAVYARRQINGEEYSVIPEGDQGWRVTHMGGREQRFSRNYYVTAGADGDPVRCTCPDYYYRRRECKHMRECRAMRHEEGTGAGHVSGERETGENVRANMVAYARQKARLSRALRAGLLRYAKADLPAPYKPAYGKDYRVDPAHVAGEGVPDPIAGTRLSVVLNEIRDKYGRHDPELARMAGAALKNPSGDPELFTKIRDRMRLHAGGRYGPRRLPGVEKTPRPYRPDPEYSSRAAEIASRYNWHRVADQLRLDDIVRETVYSLYKKHGEKPNQALRAAHNLFGLGAEDRGLASAAAISRFRNLLKVNAATVSADQDHPSSGLSKSYYGSDDMLLKSLRRLAEAEENLHGTTAPKTGDKVSGLAAGRSPRPGELSPMSSHEITRKLEPSAPAYFPTKKGVRVNPRAVASQYSRAAAVLRYALRNRPDHRGKLTNYGQLRGASYRAAIARLRDDGYHRAAEKLQQTYNDLPEWRPSNGMPGMAAAHRELSAVGMGEVSDLQEYLYQTFSRLHPDRAHPSPPTEDGGGPARMARTRSDLRRYGFVDAARAVLGKGRGADAGPSFDGIRYTSHPPAVGGKYSENDHLAAQAEHAGVRHALNAVGLMPADADPDTAARMTATFVNKAREHVHSNPKDPLSRFYLYTADRLKVPGKSALEHEPGRVPSAAPLPVGVRELSSAVAPIIRYLAEREGLRKPRGVFYSPPELHGPAPGEEIVPDPEELPEGHDVIDLLDPAFAEHGDEERAAADYLHGIPAYEVMPDKKVPFGGAKDKVGPVGEGSHEEGDFEIPDPGLGESEEISKIEKWKPRSPSIISSPKTAEYHQAIADTLKRAKPNSAGAYDSVIGMLMSSYGLTRRQADSVFDAYKRAGLKGKSRPAGRNTVPEDKYGLSRKADGPRRYGVNEIRALRGITGNNTIQDRAASMVGHAVRSVPLSGRPGGDRTSLHALADHMEEQGHPAAGWIRRAASGEGEGMLMHHAQLQFNAAPNTEELPGGHPQPPLDIPVFSAGHPAHGNLHIGYYHLPGDRHYVHLHMYDDSYDNSRSFLLPVTPEEVADYASKIHEAYPHVSAGFLSGIRNEPRPDEYWERTAREAGIHMSRRVAAARRMAAYRAPAGGIAVRGTFYKGGSMIPDMEGSFMNPARLAAAKRRIRAKKIPPVGGKSSFGGEISSYGGSC